ncbi:MAG: HDOD domain-containing protein [Candidatus Desulfofervidus auxilii]|nr:HDOD domain-containing protein [Candidatus Desulfofervidus auxilii]
MKKIEKILDNIKRLPPFPLVALKIMHIAMDEEVSVQEIVEIIQYDPSITANVLRWCNSPYFGLRRKITSMKEALVYLGSKHLLEIVMLSSCAPYLEKSVAGYELAQGELWRHSVACAIMSQILAKKIKEDDAVVFTGGLLHDIGKIVLSEFVKDTFDKIIQLVKKGYDFLSAEKEIIGMDHAELGGRIGEKWGFPEEITKIITYHHQPEEINDVHVSLVHLADVGVLMLGIGAGADGLAYQGKKEAYELLGLRETDLMACMAELWVNLEKVENIVNFKGKNHGI